MFGENGVLFCVRVGVLLTPDWGVAGVEVLAFDQMCYGLTHRTELIVKLLVPWATQEKIQPFTFVVTAKSFAVQTNNSLS